MPSYFSFFLISSLVFLMVSSSRVSTCLSLSPSASLCEQAGGQQLCPLAVSHLHVAMVYGALFAGLCVGLPWQGLFAILNVWQHCTDADDKHPTSHFDQ